MAEQENFGIKINVNTKDATKNLKDLDKEAKKTGESIEKPHNVNVNDKEAINSFNNIERSVDELSNKVGDLISKTDLIFAIGKVTAIIGGIKIIGAAVKKVYDTVSDTAHEIVSLGNTAAGMSMTTNNLKAWETSFKAMGFEAKQADQALGAIQDRLTSQVLHPSQQVQAAFGRMGINTYDAKGQQRSAEDVLLDVAKTFKRMNPNMALAYGQDLGLSRDVVMQMRNNPQFAKTLAEQKAKPVVTDQEEKQARDFVAKQADFGSSIDQIKNDALMPMAKVISDQLIPQLKDFATYLGKITQDEAQGVVDRGTEATTHPMSVYRKGWEAANNTITSAWNRLNTPFTPKDESQFKNNVSELPSYTKNKLLEFAKMLGYKDNELNNLSHVASKESDFQNIPSKVKATTGKRKGEPIAYGFLQYTPETIQGWLGKNANPMNPKDSLNAFKKEQAYFNNKMAKIGIAPTPELLEEFHHLGEPAFNKVLEMQRNKPNLKYGDAYKNLSPSGLMAKQNPSMVNQSLPQLQFTQPTSTQSHAVTNNINNRQMSSTSNTTHIATVNVNANNPQEFSNELRRQASYLDRANTATGMMA